MHLQIRRVMGLRLLAVCVCVCVQMRVCVGNFKTDREKNKITFNRGTEKHVHQLNYIYNGSLFKMVSIVSM